MSKDFLKQMDDEREKALRDLRRAYDQMNKTRDAYEAAFLNAVALGVRNTTIARKLGISEAAVRGYISRREETAV